MFSTSFGISMHRARLWTNFSRRPTGGEQKARTLICFPIFDRSNTSAQTLSASAEAMPVLCDADGEEEVRDAVEVEGDEENSLPSSGGACGTLDKEDEIDEDEDEQEAIVVVLLKTS